MAWRIGIDEAGYGPNLGPLVMTAVACRLPDDLAEADLWQTLEAGVRRERRGQGDAACSSTTPRRSIPRPAASPIWKRRCSASWARPVPTLPVRYGYPRLGPSLPRRSMEELAREIWFHGQTALPLAVSHACHPSRGREAAAGFRRPAIAMGPGADGGRLSQPIQRSGRSLGQQGGGAGHRLGRTAARGTWPTMAASRLHVVVDKHGGRNHYSALVQEAVGAGMTLARAEGADPQHL